MMKPRLYVDFNEMVDSNLVLLSKGDTKVDAAGNSVALREGLQISIYMDDFDEIGNRDDLVAEGVVERNNHSDWSSHVKWCCRIDDAGVRHSSDI
ncbi:MAG: hypothetical protein AAF560_10385 [Acidobacteriota bacterium]